MEYSQPDITIQARPTALQNIWNAFRKIIVRDPGFVMQLFLTIPIIAACTAFGLTPGQWFIVVLVTLVYLVASMFRSASLQQIALQPDLTPFQVSRIKCMGNAMVTITAGLSLLTYMLVFIPKIGIMI